MNPLLTDHIIIGGHRIAHGVHGTGTPVVLVHGTPSSSFIWRRVAPGLIEAGCRVHVFDLLGFGASERPFYPAVDTSVTAQVPILAALIEHWRVERPHLVGHDIGGAVAKRFAVEDPKRLAGLTLIDIVSYDSWPSKRTRRQMQQGLQTLLSASDAAHRAHFGDWLRSAVKHPERVSDDALSFYLDLISGPVGQASLFQHQISHYDPRHTLDVAEHLSRLAAIPVQLLWGADDAWQVIDWAHRLHADIPGSELHILEECGHFAMEDQPGAVTAKLIDFINRA